MFLSPGQEARQQGIRTMSYAIDGKCHNANRGTYGHECGKPAVFSAENTTGFRSGFCFRCRVGGDEARGFHGWQPYNQAREVMIAVNRNHRDASGWIDEAAMRALFETYDLPLEDRTRVWRELTNKETAL